MKLFTIVLGLGCLLGNSIAFSQASIKSKTLVSGQIKPTALALDELNMYWISLSGQILRAPKSGGKAILLANGLDTPHALVVDKNFVYCLTGSIEGSLIKVSKTGGNVMRVFSGKSLSGLAIDDSYIFFAEEGQLNTGHIKRVSKDGGQPTLISESPKLPDGLTLDLENVYWSTIHQTMSSPKAGGKAKFINSNYNGPSIAAPNGQEFAYFTTAMGKLYRAPKIWDVSEGEQAQGLFEPEAINIPGLVGPLGMATDQDFIFMLIEIHVENQSTAQLIKLNIRDSSVHLYPPMAGLTVNTEDVFLHGGVRIAIDNQFI